MHTMHGMHAILPYLFVYLSREIEGIWGGKRIKHRITKWGKSRASRASHASGKEGASRAVNPEASDPRGA
jgi:hypothetical protein